MTVGGDLEFALEAVAFAEEFATRRQRGAFWIADFEMEFAAEALGARGDSGSEEEQACQQGQAGEKNLDTFSVHC